MTYSKELTSQIYRQGRLLDTTDKIRFNRLTSSMQIKSPIVEFLTPDKNSDTKNVDNKEYTQEEIFDISMANVCNNASWALSDVLVATPMTLAHVLK